MYTLEEKCLPHSNFTCTLFSFLSHRKRSPGHGHIRIHLKLEIRSQTKQLLVLGKQSCIIIVLGVMLSLAQPQLFLVAFTADILPKYYYSCSTSLLQSFFFENTIDANSGFSCYFPPSRYHLLKCSSVRYAKNGTYRGVKHGLAVKEFLVLLMGKSRCKQFSVEDKNESVEIWKNVWNSTEADTAVWKGCTPRRPYRWGEVWAVLFLFNWKY